MQPSHETTADPTAETTAAVIAEVFLCVLRPLAARVADRWRRAGPNPWRWLVAAVGTVLWSVLGLLYAVAALVVPLTYVLLLTISSPVVIGALLQRHLGGPPLRLEVQEPSRSPITASPVS